jgi:hypothetical protein
MYDNPGDTKIGVEQSEDKINHLYLPSDNGRWVLMCGMIAPPLNLVIAYAFNKDALFYKDESEMVTLKNRCIKCIQVYQTKFH